MNLNYNQKEFYRAHLARDPRFDGKFFVAVKTTKIYCRPICPARKAKLKNLEFFLHAVQAEEAGYRPCMRCRTETAPDSPAWMGTSGILQRAIRMMDCFALEELSIKNMAVKLGIGERWLRDIFQQQLGVNPQSLLISKKLDIARNLLDTSSFSVTEIAFSAGFQSLRRFNDAFKSRFQKTPSAFKKEPSGDKQFSLELNYRPPYAWKNMMQFLRNRCLSKMELADENTYQRLITHGDVCGWFKVSHTENNKIDIEFKFNKNPNMMEFVARLKNIFDLDADPMVVENSLKEDEKLKPYLEHYKGLRIPGGWDGFELAVRAIVGQRISVKAARAILERIVTFCGERQKFDESLQLEYFFPTPENILAADLSNIGLPKSRVETLKNLASAIVNKTLFLDGTADFEDTCKKLLSIKGIGPWTVEYIAMRALRNPNAFPSTDLEIQKKIAQLQLNPQLWIPWRAYAAILLWNLPQEEKS